jgi:hypothetical protein
MRLNRAAYQQLIKEDIEWLRAQPLGSVGSLEREHIERVLERSVELEYQRTLRVRNTQTGESAEVFIDDEGGQHRIALGGCSYELEWVK